MVKRWQWWAAAPMRPRPNSALWMVNTTLGRHSP